MGSRSGDEGGVCIEGLRRVIGMSEEGGGGRKEREVESTNRSRINRRDWREMWKKSGKRGWQKETSRK